MSADDRVRGDEFGVEELSDKMVLGHYFACRSLIFANCWRVPWLKQEKRAPLVSTT